MSAASRRGRVDLRAENEQLKDEKRELHRLLAEKYGVEADLQQAIDALREISQARSFRGPSVMGETVEGLAGFARAALVKLGEQP